MMSVRNQIVKACGAFLAATLALAALDAAAQSVKVGYVNLARIEKESAASQAAQAALKQEFEPRHLQLLEFQKRINAAREQFKKDRERLSAAEAQEKGRELTDMMRQSDQTAAQFSEEFELRRNALRAQFIAEVRAAITSVAEAGKYDMVLQEAIFAGPGIDMTEQVLKEMAKRGGGR